MADKQSNFSGSGKNRIMLFIAVIVVAIFVGIGFWHSKNSATGATSSASLVEAPQVQSTPGVGKAPSREYVKLQQEQNAQEVIEAQKKGTSAIPTIIRASYVGNEAAKGSPDTSQGCDIASLVRAKEAGVSAAELRCRGCSAAALRGAGYTAGELREAGFTAEQLKNAGFSVAELRQSGFNVAELKAAGFNAFDLAAAGFSAAELKAAGFSAAELAKAGFSLGELAKAGFTTTELKTAFRAEELKAAGIGADLDKGACDPKELKRQHQNGATAATLRTSGCGAAALKAAGYTAAELKAAGFAAKDLRDAGFSAKELKAAGFKVTELKDAGYNPGELKAAGLSAQELKDAGFTAAQLRQAGFTVEELKRAGFLPAELKGAGYSAGELTRAGVDAALNGGGQALAAAVGSTGLGGATGTAPAAQVVALGGGVSASGAPTDPAAAALERLQRTQALHASDQERKQKLDQMRQGMATQATELLGSWSPPTPQQMVMGVELVTPAAADGANASDGSDPQAVDGHTTGTKGTKTEMAPGTYDTIKAGTIMFGVLDVGINSDDKSPVLATIVEGQLRGAKLLGAFTHGDRDQKVLLKFELMNVPRLSESVDVNCVAIDGNTAHTMLADRVDNHYMLRYGTLFASSFISGLAKAVNQSGSSTTLSPVGATVSQPKLDTAQLVISGFGEVGTKYASSLSASFTTPTTVYVNPGTGVGILFMKDLNVRKSPEQLGNM